MRKLPNQIRVKLNSHALCVSKKKKKGSFYHVVRNRALLLKSERKLIWGHSCCALEM